MQALQAAAVGRTGEVPLLWTQRIGGIMYQLQWHFTAFLWDLFGCEAYDYFNIFCGVFANDVPW